MDCDTILAAKDRFVPGRAFGTVPRMPLSELATLTGGLYGDAGQLLMEHSAFPLLALGLLPEMADALGPRLMHGGGRSMQPTLRVWAGMRVGGIRVCPECEAASWERFGVSAFFWPHLVPFVQACPWHGCTLLERCPHPIPILKRSPAPPATADLIAYSQAILAIVGLGDRHLAVSHIAERLIAAGFLSETGRARTRAFSEAFCTYCGDLNVAPSLRKLAALPGRGAKLLAWVAGSATLHPIYLALLWMFLQDAGIGDARAAKPDAAPQPSRKRKPAPQRAWRAGRLRPLPVDGRHRYTREDLPDLIARQCTPNEIARLCRLSLDTVYRVIRQLGLRPALTTAQLERIRLEARQLWLARMRAAPQCSANRIARLEPRLFHWLSRQDAAWLHDHWPQAVGPTSLARRDAHGVSGQDASLAAKIRRAAAWLAQEYPNRRPSLAALRRQLGMSEYALRKASNAARVQRAIDHYLDMGPVKDAMPTQTCRNATARRTRA
ncbi:TnsD family Tn7-like transposition protein [Cupriavidus sp. CP313]